MFILLDKIFQNVFFHSHLSSNYFPRCIGFCVFSISGRSTNTINPRVTGISSTKEIDFVIFL